MRTSMILRVITCCADDDVPTFDGPLCHDSHDTAKPRS